MKYITFTCALTFAVASALNLEAQHNAPSIEINISGLDDFGHDDGEIIEINVDLDDEDEEVDLYATMEDTDSDYDTMFQSAGHQMANTEEAYTNPTLQGFNFGIDTPFGGIDFNPGSGNVGINTPIGDINFNPFDLLSSDQQANQIANANDPTLQGFNFGIDTPFGGIDFDPNSGIGINIPINPIDFLDLFSGQSCWLKSYGRGVGKVITDCPADKDKNGLLCYPKCRAGFKGVGPVCWQSCPSDFRDDGAFCAKPAPYGRGTGSFSNHNGYERWGLLFYPKCKSNFHNVACCICSPDCPSGMTDIGVSCAKKSYGRTAGTPLTCSPGLELSGALCYPPCQNGTKGIGPVCWGQCPAGTKQCGALCQAPGEECLDYIAKSTLDVLSVTMSIAGEDVAGAVSGAADVAEDFVYPVCGAYK